MKILLVRPQPALKISRILHASFLHLEPLDLEIVAGGVSAQDDVRILDLTVERDPDGVFVRMLTDYAPDVVGLSGYSTAYKTVAVLAQRTKEIMPDAFVFIGGVHATLQPMDFTGSAVDAIVRGEGATALSAMLQRMKAGKPAHDGLYVISPKDPLFAEQSKMPPPPYVAVTAIPRPRRDLVDRSKYFSIWTHSDSRKLTTAFPRMASMRTSLGCPFSCSFCAIHFMMNRAYLQRTPEDVVDEIASIKEDHIYFVDDEMFINLERVTRIAELLKERGIEKKYVSWARSDTIVRNPDLFKLWKSVGLEIVYVGFESMDESRLKEYSKKTGPETNRKAAEVLRACGITLHAAFIVHPDFDENDFARLEKEVVKLCPAEVTFTVLSPAPGTPLWYEHRHDFICDPFANYDCFHTIIPTKLSLQKFYRLFGKLNAQALRYNPLRMHGIKAPLKDFLRAFVGGIRYISALFMLYKDYPSSMWLAEGRDQLTRAKEAGNVPDLSGYVQTLKGCDDA